MSAERIVYENLMQIFKVFKAQHPKNHMDVVFEIQGKELYAHKTMLLISPTFESMLSDHLTIFEPILIENYTLEDFKEFLTFIYSGQCQLSNENIFSMIAIAEFYRVQKFKKICEEFLTKTELTLENIYQMIRISNKYSLAEFNPLIIDFASKNISTFLKNDQFYGLKKCTLKKILELSDKTKHQEVVFEAKTKGELQCDEMKRVVNVIKSLKNKCCLYGSSTYSFWQTAGQKPLTPSKLIKNEKIDWYLIYDSGEEEDCN
uniref:BTB domain-containing protein n=1 Tax=Panagrolaimus sp. PS1159 TaxID=55785 RepID=A0AC35FXL5_9BILA